MIEIIESDEQYENFASSIEKQGLPYVLMFSASWCGPCKRVYPVFQQLAEQYSGMIRFAKVDVDGAPTTTRSERVESMPTFIGCLSNRQKSRFNGANQNKLEQLVHRVAASVVNEIENETEQKNAHVTTQVVQQKHSPQNQLVQEQDQLMQQQQQNQLVQQQNQFVQQNQLVQQQQSKPIQQQQQQHSPQHSKAQQFLPQQFVSQQQSPPHIAVQANQQYQQYQQSEQQLASIENESTLLHVISSDEQWDAFYRYVFEQKSALILEFADEQSCQTLRKTMLQAAKRYHLQCIFATVDRNRAPRVNALFNKTNANPFYAAYSSSQQPVGQIAGHNKSAFIGIVQNSLRY